MAYKEVNFSTVVFQKTGNIIRERNCNAFVATVIGDTNAKVNGKLLFASATPLISQGDSFAFSCEEDDIFVGIINIQFILPMGVNPQVEIVQRFYIKDCK
jgi:hypothetical protein